MAQHCLIIVDLQNDFCPGGALAVPGGDEIVPHVNRLIGEFDHVILTQDWHPPGHSSFASLYPGKKPFDTIELNYGEQILWPDHCIQGSPGAAFHADLQGRQGRTRSSARASATPSIPIRPFSRTTTRPRPGLPAICSDRGIDFGDACRPRLRLSASAIRRSMPSSAVSRPRSSKAPAAPSTPTAPARRCGQADDAGVQVDYRYRTGCPDESAIPVRTRIAEREQTCRSPISRAGSTTTPGSSTRSSGACSTPISTSS